MVVLKVVSLAEREVSLQARPRRARLPHVGGRRAVGPVRGEPCAHLLNSQEFAMSNARLASESNISCNQPARMCRLRAMPLRGRLACQSPSASAGSDLLLAPAPPPQNARGNGALLRLQHPRAPGRRAGPLGPAGAPSSPWSRPLFRASRSTVLSRAGPNQTDPGRSWRGRAALAWATRPATSRPGTSGSGALPPRCPRAPDMHRLRGKNGC